MSDNQGNEQHQAAKKSGTKDDQQKTPSVSQADGTAADSPKGETQAHAAQSNAGQAGNTDAAPGDKKVKSQTPENREGKINPSAPTQATEGGETASSRKGLPANPTMDSAGEVGEPSGKGNMDVRPKTMDGTERGQKKEVA